MNSATTAEAAIPLVLVPGLMCDGAVWEPVVPLLADDANCQVVDHGSADSLVGMAQQALAAAPPRFALAGHSMGGRVAAEMLRLAPQRITRLALLDTGYRPRAEGAKGDEEARGRYALLGIARSQGVRAMASRWVQDMVHPARLADGMLLERIVAMFERRSADVFECQIRALLQRPDAATALTAVQVPTLVLCGRDDSWSPVVQHEEIAALMPRHAELRVIENAGHMSTMERPEAVARALRDWLRR